MVERRRREEGQELTELVKTGEKAVEMHIKVGEDLYHKKAKQRGLTEKIQKKV